ncbi:MAG TPA: ABC transporter permease [Syntrophales bacterium]|nr:ABC transporter permease [Syntrophales bacterium]
MKTLACFIKTFRENLRDWKILILTIVFAPFFIYLMYMYMRDSGSVECNVVLINNDIGGSFSGELTEEWKKLKTESGRPVLNIRTSTNSFTARDMIKNRNADLLVTIPEGFSASLEAYIRGIKGIQPAVRSYGDQTNTRYLIAASFVDYTIVSYISQKTGVNIPVNIKYEYAGRGKNLKEFDLYVPALLVLSIIMILFTSGASIIREVEKDTITRLSLSKLKSAEFMMALSFNQIIIGLFCFLLTLIAAISVGFRTSGSVPLLLLIGALTCFSVIAISIITCSFIKTMFGLLTLGCFPFFILMFFSDCFMPLPKINLFNLAGQQIYLNDILPTATATRALNKILNYNSGLSDVLFEILWILLLSIVYFYIGIRLFKRKYRY